MMLQVIQNLTFINAPLYTITFVGTTSTDVFFTGGKIPGSTINHSTQNMLMLARNRIVKMSGTGFPRCM
jgi:hypothetical protein